MDFAFDFIKSVNSLKFQFSGIYMNGLNSLQANAWNTRSSLHSCKNALQIEKLILPLSSFRNTQKYVSRCFVWPWDPKEDLRRAFLNWNLTGISPKAHYSFQIYWKVNLGVIFIQLFCLIVCFTIYLVSPLLHSPADDCVRLISMQVWGTLTSIFDTVQVPNSLLGSQQKNVLKRLNAHGMLTAF